ncbi:MAG: hypothetical protein ACJAXS_001475 [Colwellia sp.]|jgi:hypothetical protein
MQPIVCTNFVHTLTYTKEIVLFTIELKKIANNFNGSIKNKHYTLVNHRYLGFVIRNQKHTR